MPSSGMDQNKAAEVEAPNEQAEGTDEFGERGRYGDDNAGPSWACYGIALGIVLLGWLLTLINIGVVTPSLNIVGGILFWIATITIWSGCCCNCINTVPHGCCCCDPPNPDYPNKFNSKRAFVATGWVLCACTVCWIILIVVLLLTAAVGLAAVAVDAKLQATPNGTDINIADLKANEDFNNTIVEEQL